MTLLLTVLKHNISLYMMVTHPVRFTVNLGGLCLAPSMKRTADLPVYYRTDLLGKLSAQHINLS